MAPFDPISQHPVVKTCRLGKVSAAVLGALLGLSCLSNSALADKIRNPTAVFSGLDKITGRIISFEVGINETVQFGALQLTPRICYSRPTTEAPNTTGFVEVDEVTLANEYRRIFTGWMFASSPGLHGIEHPIYDLWLTGCKGGTQVIPDTKDATPTEEDAPSAPDRTDQKPRRPARDVEDNGFDAPPAPRSAPSRRYYPTNDGGIRGRDPSGGNR